MEEDLMKDFYRKRWQFMFRTWTRLNSLIKAYKIAVENKDDFMTPMLKKVIDPPVFSNYYKHLNTFSGILEPREIEEIYDLDRTGFFSKIYDLPHADKLDLIDSLDLDVYQNPDFEFSDNPVTFKDEFLRACMFVSFGDPRLDFTVMKALFKAGKIIQRLEHEGKKRSDIPIKAGKSSWKNKVDKQAVHMAFHRLDPKETKGKSKNAICEAVREALIYQEDKKGERKRDVYSVKSIGRILKEELEKIS
jgi:hypothetical protein